MTPAVVVSVESVFIGDSPLHETKVRDKIVVKKQNDLIVFFLTAEDAENSQRAAEVSVKLDLVFVFVDYSFQTIGQFDYVKVNQQTDFGI